MHKVFWLGLAVIALGACTMTPTRIDVDREQRNRLRQLENWHAEGKLGVRLKDDAHSAYFEWQHRPEGFDLRLSGPFGQGTTWLRRKGPLVTLESPDQPIMRATSEEQLMMRQLGWQVPVSNLRYWIKGVAAPEGTVSNLKRNADGTLAELHQQGWDISYSRYGVHDGWALPGKLVARRGSITLTMIIKNWQLPDAQPSKTLDGSH